MNKFASTFKKKKNGKFLYTINILLEPEKHPVK